MNYLETYITTFTGFQTQVQLLPKAELKGMAIYIKEAYNLYDMNLRATTLLLVEPIYVQDLKIKQVQKHLAILTNTTGKTCVLLLKDVPAYMYGRLIEKGINFIVPNKQIYLPGLLIHLKQGETKPHIKGDNEALIPVAQYLLIYHLLHHYEEATIENQPLKKIAMLTGYTQPGITLAVRNLEEHQLITVRGTKEKYIHFNLQGKELWMHALKDGKLSTPVLKRIYVDAKPDNTPLLRANATALPEYSDMNPDAQEYFAIDKNAYYALDKANKLIHPNPTEGKYCLEVWKYDPARLPSHVQVKNEVVDQLNLYLSMQDMKDERIEMALDQIINQFPW